MKLFADTVDLQEIQRLVETGLLDGVTTNPSLIAKNGGNYLETLAAIAERVDGPVSAEVVATDGETMLQEGLKLARMARNIAVKVPMTPQGLRTCQTLSERGIMVNVTLCFSSNQALLAAKSGATFISAFIGRLDDIGLDGMMLIHDIRQVYDMYDFETEVLAASIRSVEHVTACALAGADVATIPPQILWEMFDHDLTNKGLEAFLSDWARTGQSLL